MAIKFQTNVPQPLLFPYGDFMEVSGQYGQQFLYTVETDGQRDRLYATPTLHQELQSAGVEPETILTITKVESEGNRKGWKIEEPGPTSAPEAATTDLSTPSNGHVATAQPRPDFKSLESLLCRSLAVSWQAWLNLDGEVRFSSEDVRAVGISLFLECARKNIIPHSTNQKESLPF